MNNKEFIAQLATRHDYTQKEAAAIVATIIAETTHRLEEGEALNVPLFGTIEVKKKAERITVNPVSKLRMLVPPKLTVTFKPSRPLKEKFRTL